MALINSNLTIKRLPTMGPGCGIQSEQDSAGP